MPEDYDDDDTIGVCSECKSDQMESYLLRNRFAQVGAPIPCQFCGGIVILCSREYRDRALRDADRGRGLG